MACEEARAMLDALMGSDRNAPLPKGAAIPGRKRGGIDNEYQQMMKRKKSCYDKDIDPVYTAWGVDVYDLFINTKSDIGTNPYIVDKAAHEEYINLPKQEQERLGYEYILFHKLSDLVRQGDRMIARNKEKLKQELNRKLSQRNYQDFVQDVDSVAVEQLARAMITLEDMTIDFQNKLKELEQVTNVESDRKRKLELLLEANRIVTTTQATSSGDENHGQPNSIPSNDMKDNSETKVPEIHIKEEEVESQSTSDVPTNTSEQQNTITEHDRNEMVSLQNELGQLTLQKQRLVYEISHLITLIVPQNDTVESQRRHLNYVKSDISTDKTVCEISGNNMSSRDADERIAAHYSGKQYIGWKLVRDKLQSMIQKYGRNGPPPPSSSSSSMSNRSNANGFDNRRGPPPSQQSSFGGGAPPGGRGPYGDSGRGRDYADRGGYRSNNNNNSRDSWNRHGSSGGPRGGGGGGYNNDRRYPPNSDDRGWRR